MADDTTAHGHPAPGRVYIKTFGCQMNVYDTEKLYAALADRFHPAAAPEDADLILLNTCSVRGKAEQKVYSLLGRLRPLKEARPHLLVGVGGCVAQQEGHRLLERSPVVDLVFGTHNLDEVPDLVEERLRTGRGVCRIREEAAEGRPAAPLAPQRRTPAALLTIMKGCDNFCAYCVVPLVRGRETSRPAAEVLEEARRLIDSGSREITLLGQNVNSYRDPSDGTGFVGLLERVDRLEGLERLRFVTSHPRDFSPSLVSAMASLPTLCEHIHLPVQAGSDRVLEAMGRGYTRGEYLERLQSLREALPGVEVSTDVIVGFPGEERSDFDQTLDLVRRAGFLNAFSFRFSPRPGTAAASMPDILSAEARRSWLPELQAAQNEVTARKHQAMVGTVAEVLVEGRGKGGEGALEGRTRTNYIVHFPGRDAMIGRVARVRIRRSRTIHLEGEADHDEGRG